MKRIRPHFDAYDSPTDGSALDVRLTEMMNAWAIWMHTGEYGRGYPRKAPGLRTGAGNDVSDMLRDGAKRTIEAIDAAVDGLPQNEQLAIRRAYGLIGADVWKLREPWDVLEARARVLIRERLRERRVE